MSMQDTISDMLTRIRNGQRAKLKSITFPSTKFKLALIKLFLEEGYILAYKITEGIKPQMIVELKYFNNEPVIQSITRVSKPGLRIYRGCKTLPSVLGGLGIAIISTSKGLMTDKKARLNGIGGEVICCIS